MKRLRLAILLLLIPLCCIAFAALTKTTSIVELDAWQALGNAAVSVGNAGNISGSYDIILYLEIAYADTDAQDGVDVIVEVSYGDDDWTLLTSFTTPAEIAQDGFTLDGNHTAGDTTIDTSEGPDAGPVANKWFIEDGALELSSESVRTESITVNEVTICHDILRNHTNGDSLWAYVHEYVIPIPKSFAYVRVTINNTDVNAGIFYTTRISKVTSL